MSVAEAFEAMTIGAVPWDAGPARAWIAGLPRGRGAEVRAPDGTVLARLRAPDPAAAARAGGAWAALDPAGRCDRLAALADRVEPDLLALLGALEGGAAVTGGAAEARALGATLARAAAAALVRPAGLEPIGLVAAPDPAAAAAPLAAGCAVALDPPAGAVLAALRLAEAAAEVEVPLFRGAGPAEVAARAEGAPPPVHVVLDDADLASAAEGIARSLGWGGRARPVRVVAGEPVAAALAAAIRDRLGALRLGDPLDPTVDVGAVPDASGLAALGAAERRARVHRAGSAPEGCVPPALVEAFGAVDLPSGPIVVMGTARTGAEAAGMAAGGAICLWGEGPSALVPARTIRAGVVAVNGAEGPPLDCRAPAPFVRAARPDVEAAPGRALVAGRLRPAAEADAVAPAPPPDDRGAALMRIAAGVPGAEPVRRMAALALTEAPAAPRPARAVAALCGDDDTAAAAIGAILAVGSAAVIVAPPDAEPTLALARALLDAGVPPAALSVLSGPHDALARSLAPAVDVVWALSGPAAEAAARAAGAAVRADLTGPGPEWLDAARTGPVVLLPDDG